MGLLQKVLYKLAGTSEEVQKIYTEKGLCPEYVEAYHALHPKPKTFDKCLIADMYLAIDQFDKAGEILDSIHIGFMSDDDEKGMYYYVLMNYLMLTKRKDEAISILKREQKYLNIYWGSPGRARFCGAFYDCVATLSSTCGYSDIANYYYQLEQAANAKYDQTGLMSPISKLNILYAAKSPEADAQVEPIRQQIEAYNDYKNVWEKDYFLKLLEKAKRFAEL